MLRLGVAAAVIGLVGLAVAQNPPPAPTPQGDLGLLQGNWKPLSIDFEGKPQVSAEEMIRPEDIAESVRCLLRLSPACVIPEIIYHRPGEGL